MSKSIQHHSTRKSGTLLALAMTIGVTLALTLAPDTAQSQTVNNGKTFLPSGHIYTPYSRKIPHPNSRLGRVEANTDVYETEVYRRQLKQKRTQDRFRRFIDRDYNHPESLH